MTKTFDIAVIGSGPGGQKAAVQGVKSGRSVVLIEREPAIGGACVQHGTIPSKTLRHNALAAQAGRDIAYGSRLVLDDGVELGALMSQLERVVKAHSAYMARQISRNGIDRVHGKARLVGTHRIDVRGLDGTTTPIEAETIVIATGSRPRTPPAIPVDHEHILDSDSILSLSYLPKSLAVLGGGVIASEYASIFAHLGVEVTMIDRTDRPLRFLDEEITRRFVDAFERNGGRYLGERAIGNVAWDGLSEVVTELQNGESVRSEKTLVALGRVACVADLGLEAAGIELTDRGVIPVDEHCQTVVPNIYAVGDVIGPPALAATAMEQGRRAVRHALGLSLGAAPEMSPMGIYTIPEMASVGLDEAAARQKYGEPIVGRARFDEVARGQIAGITDGLLKIVADPEGVRPLGFHVLGEGATEIIHLGQMALLSDWEVDRFVENIFNFPTLAEAYRVAALDVVEQRDRRATRQPLNDRLAIDAA